MWSQHSLRGVAQQCPAAPISIQTRAKQSRQRVFFLLDMGDFRVKTPGAVLALKRVQLQMGSLQGKSSIGSPLTDPVLLGKGRPYPSTSLSVPSPSSSPELRVWAVQNSLMLAGLQQLQEQLCGMLETSSLLRSARRWSHQQPQPNQRPRTKEETTGKETTSREPVGDEEKDCGHLK